MEVWKKAKILLLNQSCENCLFFREDLKPFTLWCLKYPFNSKESLEMNDVDWCWCKYWIDGNIDLSGFFHPINEKLINTLDQVKLLEEYVLRKKK